MSDHTIDVSEACRRNGVALNARHYNASLRIVRVDSSFYDALAAVPGRGKNPSVANAKPLPRAALDALDQALSIPSPINKVGPVISMYDEEVVLEERPLIENFFGLSLAEKHIGPNKVFFNSGVKSLRIEVVVSGVRALFSDAHPLEPNNPQSIEKAGSWRVDASAAETQTITLEPSDAMIIPVETTPYRFLNDGRVLVLHGYFI